MQLRTAQRASESEFKGGASVAMIVAEVVMGYPLIVVFVVRCRMTWLIIIKRWGVVNGWRWFDGQVFKPGVAVVCGTLPCRLL